MKNRIKLVLSKLFKGVNIKQFGLFFVAGFIFLMISKYSESSIETLNFAIEVTDIPSDVVLRNLDASSLKIEVKSTGFRYLAMSLQGLKPIKLSAKNDLIALKDSSYLWTLGQYNQNLNNKLPSGVDLISASPDTLLFSFEKLSSKKVPVVLNTSITYALGYDLLGTIEQSLDSVTLVGSKAVLDSIYNIQTESIVETDKKTDIDVKAVLINPNPEQVKLEVSSIGVSAQVKRFTEGELRIPVTVINVPSDIEINFFPKELSLNYYMDLERFKEVSAEDFEIICDFQEHKTTGEFFLTPEVNIKSNRVKSARTNTRKIDFIFL